MLSDKASEDTYVDSKDGKSYKFNINDGLSKLLIDGLLKCGQVDRSKGHIFDYDNQFIATEKYDSRYSYKKAFGYFPGIAQIDGLPFYIEGRYVYRCILTNDHDMSDEEVVVFYNQRASTERCFDCMNNDFGWSHLPCSEMKSNTVFMILTAFIHNFYRFFLGLVAGKDYGLEVTSRVKRFVVSFISVPFKWVNCGAKRILRLFTRNRAYLSLQV